MPYAADAQYGVHVCPTFENKFVVSLIQFPLHVFQLMKVDQEYQINFKENCETFNSHLHSNCNSWYNPKVILYLRHPLLKLGVKTSQNIKKLSTLSYTDVLHWCKSYTHFEGESRHNKTK